MAVDIRTLFNHSYRLNKLPFIMFLDSCIIALAYFVSLWGRFNFSFGLIPKIYVTTLPYALIPAVILGLVALFMCNTYKTVWRFASVSDLQNLILAVCVQQVLLYLVVFFFRINMPRSFWLLGVSFEVLLLFSMRFSYRYVYDRFVNAHLSFVNDSHSKNLLIIGAGSCGRMYLKEILSNKSLGYKPVCFVDDNEGILHKKIDGISILGTRNDIDRIVKEQNIQTILFAITSLSQKDKVDILNICKKTRAEIKIVPELTKLLEHPVAALQLNDVSLEDLLERDPIRINNNEIHKFLHNKRVLVTGGGGSIGSELCRQIAKDNPQQLIIFDIYENNAYAIEQELKTQYPDLNLLVLIGSVRDKYKVDDVFAKYHPEIVFHAAAHKHVPLMQTSPHEAIKNNVMGTYNVALSALNHKASRFLLISTDKAVNPTNIMGASKRLCEMIVQMMDRRSLALGPSTPTKYSAVRFGNVLGSNGSVVPLFKKQIKEGGPVTVTHKDIVRYFMTIPEAVSLVLQSSYYARGGEIFVLDMGEPVKILDMARNLIYLSGLEPEVDIPIVFTGLRPGEKLFEELLMDEEGLEKTSNSLIYIGSPISMNDDEFNANLEVLFTKAYNEDCDIIQVVSNMVETFHPELGA